MKKKVRLTESDLHRIVKESVKRILRETQYMDDGNLEPQYDKNPDSMWTYGTNLNPQGVSGLDPHSVRGTGLGNKKQDNLASWDYFDAVSQGADMKMRDQANHAYDERTKPLRNTNDYKSKYDKQAYLYSRDYPTSQYNHLGINGWADDLKQDFDKQWQNTKDIEKYSKQADSRPLHRKGSLNRLW